MKSRMVFQSQIDMNPNFLMGTAAVDGGIFSADFGDEDIHYCGQSLPTGTLACDILNIPNEVWKKFDEQANIINAFNERVCLHNEANRQLMNAAGNAMLEIIRLLKDVPPFSYMGYERIASSFVGSFGTPEKCEAALQGYATMDNNALRFQKWSASIMMIYFRMTPVRNLINAVVSEINKKGLHKPSDYAEAFERAVQANEDKYIRGEMQFPGGMVYYSENGIFRRRYNMYFYPDLLKIDFYEGLRCGHAPSLCENCGRYWLATNGNVGRYCNGTDPNDPEHRPCRNIAAAKGRSRKELKKNNPIEYEKNNAIDRAKKQMQYGSITEEEYKKICVLISKKAKQATRNHDYFLNGYIDELKMKALKEELKSA